ncbi:hypothetical protein [Kribbella deserti]|uniref:Uncharacterized protein n=1 Tax=Kribbella deserti TaxID=1926257 RepID=A0ABV6QFB9_9ACTN
MTQTAASSRNAHLRAQHALTADELEIFLDCESPERDLKTTAADPLPPGSAAVLDEQR